MKTLSALIALALGLVLPAPAETELKGNPRELASYLAQLPQMVSITGESEVKVPADKAEVTIKVTTDSKSLSEALRLNQEARGRVAAFLLGNGFSTNQIQGAKFSSTQKSGWFSDKAKNHRIDNFLKIVVRDEKEFQTVGNAVDKWPEVQLIGIDVQHSDKQALKAKAHGEALAKAGERRRMYEENLGVKLVPKGFQESSSSPPPQAPLYANRAASIATGYEKTSHIPEREPGSSEEIGSPFGELTFTARVVVQYAVESK
jgi:uncharacterized protein YggE